MPPILVYPLMYKALQTINCGQDRQLIWIDKILLLRETGETVRTWSELQLTCCANSSNPASIRSSNLCELQQASEAPRTIRNEELSNY